MNILLISQCHKNALKETRRILDQFAERCGDRSWQTPMTQAGLDTLHKLLRQNARKNTAVACYWTHGKNLTELLWIVGDRKQFNDLGRTPTNRTRRNVLRGDDESAWQYGTSVQILATLAALLHDLGKATIGFQAKLQPNHAFAADPFRHEWLSLLLFTKLLKGCETNQQCLERLANLKDYDLQHPQWHASLSPIERFDLTTLPPIAQLLGWLIVTHHRLPYRQYYTKPEWPAARKSHDYVLDYALEHFYEELAAIDGWVKNSTSTHPQPQHFWQLADDVIASGPWQKTLSRWANKALAHPPLMTLGESMIQQPFVFHLSRLCLMVGDHNYSSLPPLHPNCVKGDPSYRLFANTDRKTGQTKQALDEHLIGVAQHTARFARLLPQLGHLLPAIQKHRAFSKRTAIQRFTWQNHAFDLAKNLQEMAQEQGFFGVNMASTGCGKTLANARIMYGLADPNRGARFTIALGLRVLTLQTGQALRDKLSLSDEHLAILVGGQASRQLFELNQSTQSPQEASGSESATELVIGEVNVSASGLDEADLGTVVADKKARDLLYAPIVSCTVDYLMAASENTRGGKHIAPILRLLSADLVLDEPDDFDHRDLPALARLVHLAGLFGSKVLLSSATLTPDLITGLFDAYQAGRALWQQQNQLPQNGVICAWFDEAQQGSQACLNKTDYTTAHQAFANKRAERLQQVPIRRSADILALALPDHNKDVPEPFFDAFATQLLNQAQVLHRRHGNPHPSLAQTVSLGLIRMANTKDLIQTTFALHRQPITDANTHYHVCCYHAKQLLLLRSALEEKLDRLLDRHDPEAIWQQPEIIDAIRQSPAQHHVFIVLATPVAEVGRDHDYDWAIVEPSSMRSLIQLAGRVWRHRPNKVATSANISLLSSNLRALKKGPALGVGEPSFCYPGFEAKPNALLNTHLTEDLISPEERAHINAVARIVQPQPLQAQARLADLEHDVMAKLLNPATTNFVTAYWQPGSAHQACVHLQTISPFRYGRKQASYVCQPDEAQLHGFSFRLARLAYLNPNDTHIDTANDWVRHEVFNPNPHGAVQPWLPLSLEQALHNLANKLGEENLARVALKYATVDLEDEKVWLFHPWLGCWRK